MSSSETSSSDEDLSKLQSVAVSADQIVTSAASHVSERRHLCWASWLSWQARMLQSTHLTCVVLFVGARRSNQTSQANGCGAAASCSKTG